MSEDISREEITEQATAERELAIPEVADRWLKTGRITTVGIDPSP